MNMVKFKRALNRSVIFFSLVGTGLVLSACGGGDSKKSTTNSSSSTSSSSHSFIPTPVTPSGDGNWPNIKVSANGTKTLKFEWNAVAGSTYYKLLKKLDKNSDYVQVGSDFTSTIITDTVNVHLTDWVDSRYKIQKCNNEGCQDSNEIATNSAMLNAITYIKASNTDTNDWFGWSIAVSADGKTLAVGAPGESSNATGINQNEINNESPSSGAVYIFVKKENTWEKEAYIKASNTEQPDKDNDGMFLPNDRFGYRVALSADGNTLAVSAINEDSMSLHINCSEKDTIDTYDSSSSSVTNQYKRQTDTGAVYVFKRANTTWIQTAFIKPPIYTTLDFNVNLSFGQSLALSGNGKTLAIGSQADSAEKTGVFHFSSPSSNQSSSETACNNLSTSSSVSSSSTSSSSSSSSINSSSIAAPGGAGSGAVFTYIQQADGWQENSYIKASDAGNSDAFGGSISLDYEGQVLAVGATGEDSIDQTASDSFYNADGISGGSMDVGAVYIFKRTGTGWEQTTKLKPKTPQWNHLFGYSVAVSGDGLHLAIGAPGDWSKGKGTDTLDSNFIYETEKTLNYSPIYGNYYTWSPIYSATGEKSALASGACYLFSFNSGAWTQTAYLKASNSSPALQFGESVAITHDGNKVVVGTFTESSQATGINGDQEDLGAPLSGAAYFFVKSGANWIQKSYIKAPNTNAQDRFARSIGLDLTGENLFIGAYREASKATSVNGDKSDNSSGASGAVYIY